MKTENDASSIAGYENETPRRPTKWARLAAAFAANAHLNHFAMHRGVWHFEAANVLVVFNNSPYASSSTLRDEETAEFRKRLAAEGLKELAYATHGDDDIPDYSYALVIDAGRDRVAWVTETIREIVVATLNWAKAASMAGMDASN